MDCGFNWEYNSLINELTQGLEHAKQLRASCCSNKIQELDFHIQMICSSFEKSLSILKWNGTVTQSPLLIAPLVSTGAPESSISVDDNNNNNNVSSEIPHVGYGEDTVYADVTPKIDDQDFQYVSKKRKQMPTWSEQVRVSAENGFEGPTDDGYSWRKYGQKDILGAKYPRSYYRCTYRLMQNCWATKQVQRSDDDPTLFEITYKGSHTCNQTFNCAATQPRSPEKHKFKKQANNPRTIQSNQMLANLQANLRVNTNDLDKKEATCSFQFSPTFSGFVDENLHFQMSQVDDNLVGGYSPSFVSPTTPESNYFSLPSCQMNGSRRIHNVHHSKSDLPDLFSANTSSTSSPIIGLEFPLEHVELDPNFPFDNSEFFS